MKVEILLFRSVKEIALITQNSNEDQTNCGRVDLPVSNRAGTNIRVRFKKISDWIPQMSNGTNQACVFGTARTTTSGFKPGRVAVYT